MSHAIVGRPIPRVDDAGKVTGQARYAADIDLPGLLWAKLARSTWAHARILRISTDKART